MKYENIDGDSIDTKDIDNYDLTISGNYLDQLYELQDDLIDKLKVVARVSPK